MKRFNNSTIQRFNSPPTIRPSSARPSCRLDGGIGPRSLFDPSMRWEWRRFIRMVSVSGLKADRCARAASWRLWYPRHPRNYSGSGSRPSIHRSCPAIKHSLRVYAAGLMNLQSNPTLNPFLRSQRSHLESDTPRKMVSGFSSPSTQPPGNQGCIGSGSGFREWSGIYDGDWSGWRRERWRQLDLEWMRSRKECEQRMDTAEACGNGPDMSDECDWRNIWSCSRGMELQSSRRRWRRWSFDDNWFDSRGFRATGAIASRAFMCTFASDNRALVLSSVAEALAADHIRVWQAACATAQGDALALVMWDLEGAFALSAAALEIVVLGLEHQHTGCDVIIVDLVCSRGRLSIDVVGRG
jgi:hypothetical protein